MFDLQFHTSFRTLMSLISLSYIFLTFFEPTHLHQDEMLKEEALSVNWTIFKVELSINCFLLFDCLLGIILLVSSFKFISAVKHKQQPLYKRVAITLFRENLASVLAILLGLIFSIDFILYYHYFPYGVMRITRLLRPRNLLSPSSPDGLHDQAQKDSNGLHLHNSQSTQSSP